MCSENRLDAKDGIQNARLQTRDIAVVSFEPILRKHGIAITIPHKQNDRHKGVFDQDVYRSRNRVERLFARLKQIRRIATRYEKWAVNYEAMVTIAGIFLWSQFPYTPSAVLIMNKI